jgi:glutamate-1-semialdehyde 2,1-aminomutase
MRGPLAMRYQQSLACLDVARWWTPNGSQTSSKGATNFPEGAYPVFLQYGNGAYVTDVDGNVFLDCICSLAVMTLGHGRKEILDAVYSQLQRGWLFGLPHRLEYELAERFCAEVAPWASSVRWLKTGSEACEAAVRIARMETGRDLVLSCGYHGWHSSFMAGRLEHPGVPQAFATTIIDFPYDDLPALDTILDQHGSEVAAIIVEPTLHDIPKEGWLAGIRARCTRHGALMISDELICALRWAKGGGTEYFGVVPDLATFGKAIGGGMPLAAVAGPRELMSHARLVSSTFGGECLSLAACSAVLSIYLHEPIIERLWANGAAVQKFIVDLIEECNLRGKILVDGYPVKPRIRFTLGNEHDNNFALSLFVQELARHGVLWHPAGGNISAAMTASHLQEARSAFARAFRAVKQALDEGNFHLLQGQPIQGAAQLRQR